MVLLRKLHTFVSDPRAALVGYLNRVPRYFHDREQAHYRQHFVDLGYEHLADGRPGDAIWPDWVDLWFLYEAVRQRKPQVVLEFGSGYSTPIIAQALYDNGIGFLYSVDADEAWGALTVRLLPAHLREVCTVSYSPLLEVERHGVKGFLHEEIPTAAGLPNMIYLDGPALTDERQVAFDVLDMEPFLPHDFYMVVDGRTVQSQFLARHLTGRYAISTEAGTHFLSVFERLP